MKLEEAMKRLAKATKRLDAEQGRIARRNARQATLTALRQVRGALDEHYPAIRKESVKRRKPRTLKQRLRGMSRIAIAEMLLLIQEGVGNRQFLTIRDAGDQKGVTLYYAPTWMVRAFNGKVSPALIAKAVRSQKTRKQIDAMLRLSGRAR